MEKKDELLLAAFNIANASKLVRDELIPIASSIREDDIEALKRQIHLLSETVIDLVKWNT